MRGVVNMNSLIEKLIDTATKEIGYLEKKSNAQLDDKTANAGRNNWTKYARDLDKIGMYNGKKNGYAWCDMFVDWCFVQTFGLQNALLITGQSLAGAGAGCTSSANYYKKMGQFFKSNPQPGDQIFFSNDGGKNMNHTGLVTRVKGNIVYTIEGNTSSATGVIPNGGAVRNKQYPLTYVKIGGYGRPKYELLEEDDDMTDERFNELWANAMNNWLLNKAKEKETWGTENLEWGKRNGIMAGNANGAMMPNKLCTRLEVITMIKRLGEKLGIK